MSYKYVILFSVCLIKIIFRYLFIKKLGTNKSNNE